MWVQLPSATPIVINSPTQVETIMTLLSDLLDIQLNEVVEPVDPTLALEQQLEILEQRLGAAKRGLGFANKLKNPAQKKKHMALVFTNLNKIRGSLSKVIEQVGEFDRQFNKAEQSYHQQADVEARPGM